MSHSNAVLVAIIVVVTVGAPGPIRGQSPVPPLTSSFGPDVRPVGLGGTEFFVAPHVGFGGERFRVAGEGTFGRGVSEFTQGKGSLAYRLPAGLTLDGLFTTTHRSIQDERAVDHHGRLGMRSEWVGAWIGFARDRASTPGFRLATSTREYRAWLDVGAGLGLTLRRSRIEEEGTVVFDTTHVILGEYEFETRKESEFFREKRYSELEVDLRVPIHRLSVVLFAGHRFQSGDAPGVSWGFARVSAPISSHLELLAEFGQNEGLPSLGRGPARFGRVGVRVDLFGRGESDGADIEGDHVPDRSAATAPTAPTAGIAAGDGVSRLVVRAFGASHVEVRGDFTDWKPHAAAATPDGGWAVALEPGVYHFNIRIDGGEWTVPANLPSIPDEFSGSPVAVVVVR